VSDELDGMDACAYCGQVTDGSAICDPCLLKTAQTHIEAALHRQDEDRYRYWRGVANTARARIQKGLDPA